MDLTFYLITLFTSALAFLWLWSQKKNSKYPPGPTGIPYFGSFFAVGQTPHLKFAEWAKEYGPIFSVKIGEVKAVVLNDAKLIREALKEDSFSGRPDNKFFIQITGDDGIKRGVVFADRQTWKEQRRFLLRGLRDFGFGTKSMESIITDEVDEFMEYLISECGNSISLNRKFSFAILNSMWMVACGCRFKQNDPKLQAISDAWAESTNQAVKSGFLVFLHELCVLAPELSGWNKYLECTRNIFSMLKKQIEEHKKTHVPEAPRDFLDIYLTNIKETVDPTSTFYKEEGYIQLLSVLTDIFGAGSETTSATLTWTVLYLATNPKIQKKLQSEIDHVIGNSRRPTLADKTKMPYTDAVMQEVFRLSSILPLNLYHSAVNNVTFQGYEIPKDTYIITNLHGAHHDPNVWEQPEEFRPERFLSDDGKTCLKNENVLPFSIGKRACIGETVARDSFFLFLATIFQRFEITPDESTVKISLEPDFGFLSQPKKFFITLKDRF